MALADLVQTLEQDATAELRALLADAEARAAQLEAEGARDRAARTDAAEHACCDECQVEADARLATARRAARARLLTARAAMLERVLAAVRALLPGSTRQVAESLARAAIACAGSQAGILRCTPEIVDEIRPLVPATLRSEPSAEIRTGVLIELATGTHIVATLDALLDREWPTLSATLLARLAKETSS